jgi:hypothetical protein
MEAAMSRTYRNGIEWRYLANGVYYTFDEYGEVIKEWAKKTGMRPFSWQTPFGGWACVDIRSKRCRDGNNGVMGSAPAWYQKIRRRRERRIARDCIHHERDIPRWKNSDDWYW